MSYYVYYVTSKAERAKTPEKCNTNSLQPNNRRKMKTFIF